MSQFPFMPWYAADYEHDTKHLTDIEDLAYRRLIDAMWTYRGRLPNDPAQLARFIRFDIRKWRSVSTAVLPFFVVDGAELTHKRVTAELQKAQDLADKRAAAGRKGGRPKKGAREPKKPNGPAPRSTIDRQQIDDRSPTDRDDLKPKFSAEPAENKDSGKAKLSDSRAPATPQLQLPKNKALSGPYVAERELYSANQIALRSPSGATVFSTLEPHSAVAPLPNDRLGAPRSASAMQAAIVNGRAPDDDDDLDDFDDDLDDEAAMLADEEAAADEAMAEADDEPERATAARRLNHDLCRFGGTVHGVISDNLTGAEYERAVDAELTRPGGGLALVVELPAVKQALEARMDAERYPHVIDGNLAPAAEPGSQALAITITGPPVDEAWQPIVLLANGKALDPSLTCSVDALCTPIDPGRLAEILADTARGGTA